MTINNPPAARPDLDVALFDFLADYAERPGPALYRLQFLLLDEDTCLARVAFLRGLAAAIGSPSSPRESQRPDEEFRAEIALLCEEGVFAVRLTPERIRGLHRLTRDPDALLEAHRRLAAEDVLPVLPGEVAGATIARDETPIQDEGTGFTALARAGRLADLESKLRPWLPFLLRRAGLASDLDDTLARQFLADVRARLGETRRHRFRELLPVWLSDFARRHHLAERLRPEHLQPAPADLEADAVEHVLRRAGENEMPWATAFRESALGAGVPTARALLSFEAAEVGNTPALPNYRRDLFVEARQTYRDGLELFECDVTA